MSVYKRGMKAAHWHYYFRVRGVRYRGSIPEARTKKEAEQAESKIKQDVFEGLLLSAARHDSHAK